MRNTIKFLLSALMFFCLRQTAFAQFAEVPKDAYLAAAIPDSLKDNANSVIRYAIEEDQVTGPGKEISKFHKIITVLNEKADNQAVLSLYYDKKYESYSDISMKIYDANGNLIKKYRKGDMEDVAAMDDMNLVQDGRILYLKHTIASYPTTVEIEYEQDVNSFFDIGGWDIQGDQQSVQNSFYHIRINEGAGFRYLNKNTSIKPVKTIVDGQEDYTWTVRNWKAFKLEEGAEAWRVFPHIYFAQSKFNQEGYPGDLSTWKSYGQWQKDLNAHLDSLPPDRVAELRAMTDTIKTDKAKAAFLYHYMQQNTRYVSIQLGIGGWRPFPATFVDQKKYGDCKALSNYMKALLKAVGIKSYYAVINAEKNQEPADPNFPFNHFNHVILCVPFKNDTTWLECTDPYSPFGKLGSFTENRNALLVTEDGGRLKATPKSVKEDNLFESSAHITLDPDGGAKVQITILSTGTYRDDYIGMSTLKVDEQKDEIMRRLKIKQPISMEVKPLSDVDGKKQVDISLEYDKFCDIAAGDKQFYRPHAFDLIGFTLPDEDKRTSDYYFETPIEKSCVTTIDLPAGFEVETLPVNQALKFTYGDYSIKYTYDAAKNQVISTASFDITNQDIPAAKYNELQQFLEAVAKAQNKKLVIKRKA